MHRIRWGGSHRTSMTRRDCWQKIFVRAFAIKSQTSSSTNALPTGTQRRVGCQSAQDGEWPFVTPQRPHRGRGTACDVRWWPSQVPPSLLWRAAPNPTSRECRVHLVVHENRGVISGPSKFTRTREFYHVLQAKKHCVSVGKAGANVECRALGVL